VQLTSESTEVLTGEDKTLMEKLPAAGALRPSCGYAIDDSRITSSLPIP
jgi:hypothetical protein